MNDKVVIAGTVKLRNTIKAKTNLHNVINGTPSWVVNAGGGGIVYPHYTGSYTVTPSGSVQTLDTSDKVMDDDVTVEAVQAGSATTPATIITANPTLSRSGRVVTATVSKTQQITPTVVEGYVSAGTAGNVGVSGSDTLTIPEGSATTPATTITSNPIINVSNNGLITAKNNKTQSITPTVVEGYVSAGTAGNVTVSGFTDLQMNTQSAQTFHPSTSNQSIASGKYLTGTLTFKAVTVSGLTADKVVQGNVVKIGDADDDDRIMSVTGTASGGITPTGTKTITANGTGIDVYSYQYADVAVPNSYSASDEGKVVSNGSLVAQTSDTVTANDTYDTTLINSLTVNVQGSSGYTIDEVSTRSISGAVVLNTSSATLDLASFASITSVTGDGPTTLDTSSLRWMTALTYVNLPNITGVKNQNSTSYSIADNPNLEEMYLPKLQTTAKNHLFRNNPKLHTADIGVSVDIKGSTFFSDSALRVLILRKSDAICGLSGWNVSDMGGIYSNPTLSTIYVPQALISSYQTATNWSSAYAAGVTFAKIEGSIYEL